MSKSEAQVLDFEKICRLCLLEKRSMSSIFSKKKSDKKVPLPVRIMSCASVELYEGDGLPSSICSKCLLSVNQSYAFREQCEQADTTLRQHAQRVNETSEEASLKSPFFNKLGSEDGKIEHEVGSGDVCRTTDKKVKKMNEKQHVKYKSQLFFYDNDEYIVSPDGKEKNRSQEDGEEGKDLEFSLTTKNFDFLRNSEQIEEKNHHEPSEVRVYPLDWNRCADNVLQAKRRVEESNPGKKAALNFKKLLDVAGQETRLKHTKGFTSTQFYLEYAAQMEENAFDRNSNKTDSVYCKVCKIFISRLHFYNHVKYVHKNIRNHLCQECGYQAHTRPTLRLHIEAKHSGTILPCENCSMTFGCGKQLKLHIKKHHSEKLIERNQVCHYCGKTFTTSGYLKSHIRVHTQETPYECQFCKRKFKSKWAWKTHEHLHTGVKPYKCTYCVDAFTQNCARKNHEYRVHGNEVFNPNNRIPREENRRSERSTNYHGIMKSSG